MEANHKRVLKAVVLELRHMFEGYHDEAGTWHAGDLEQRLNALGVWRERKPLEVDEVAGLTPADREARRVVDAYLKLREEADVPRSEAVAEFVRETAYTWANRLLALRCMEARDLIDEVILQKPVYGGRSLEHRRLVQRRPELCAGEDDGLFAMLETAFTKLTEHLPLLFNPRAPGVALKPSVAALKRAIALLSGTEAVRGQEPATSEVFRAPDAFGWAYLYWSTEEKDRVFEKVRTQKDAKIEGHDVIPATQLYTEPYMVKFLVQNSLGATWVSMNPRTKLSPQLEYFVKDVERGAVEKKPVRQITFLDPACGSGHFLLEAFDLFYGMYEEEGEITQPEGICRSILEHNLYGIDIDERATQMTEAALWMKAVEKVSNATGTPSLTAPPANIVATNIRLPKGKDHLKAFLERHPEDKDLGPALEVVFAGLEHAHELGALLQIEAPVEAKLRQLQLDYARLKQVGGVQADLYKPVPIQGRLPPGIESYEAWKEGVLTRLERHFAEESETADLVDAFFTRTAGRSLRLFDLIARRYDVVAANPPYMGSATMGPTIKRYVDDELEQGKGDLYAAFIVRQHSLAARGGRVAMVTMNKWLTLSSMESLRATREAAGPLARGVLFDSTLELLADLGSRAFASELHLHDGVQVALFVFLNDDPKPSQETLFYDLRPYPEPENKSAMLSSKPIQFRSYRKKWATFRSLPKSRIMYSAPKEFLDLFTTSSAWDSGTRDNSFAIARRGLDTCDVVKWVRYWWEVPSAKLRVDEQAVDQIWVRHSRGSNGFRWAGRFNFAVKWDDNGRSLKVRSCAIIPNEGLYFEPGATFSRIGQILTARVLPPLTLISDSGSGVYSNQVSPAVLVALLNSRTVGVLLRLVNPTMNYQTGDINSLPVPPHPLVFEELANLSSRCQSYRQEMAAGDPIEFDYLHQPISFPSFRAFIWDQQCRDLGAGFVYSAVKGRIDRLCFESFAQGRPDPSTLGVLPSDYPIVSGYPDDILPRGLEATELDHVVIRAMTDAPRVHRDSSTLLNEIRVWFEAATEPAGDERASDNTAEGDHEESALNDGFPIPPETLIEDLSHKLKLHPASVYALLREGITNRGWRSRTLERSILAARITANVLLLLGHRWPKQLEARETVPEGVVADGILPLMDGTGTTLLERIRGRIAVEWKGTDQAALEREFAEIMDVSLAQWLTQYFFEHHTSQFKKRPVAWQVQSGKFSARRKPAFACLAYYQKLTAQTLTTVQSQYVRPLRQRLENEIRGIESVPQSARSERQQERLTELMDLIPELRNFDEALDSVSRTGFGPGELHPKLRQYAIDDAMLSLKSRWLDRLSGIIASGPIGEWQKKAHDTKLHSDLPQWIADAMATLRHHCYAAGPRPPEEKTLETGPNAANFARLISEEADEMVSGALVLACSAWWKFLDEAVFAPLRTQIKGAKDELKMLKEEDPAKADRPFVRRKVIDAPTKELRENIKNWQRDLDEKTKKAENLGEHILAWRCPEAATWESWLAAQPMYDSISSLDGIRQPPRTVGEYISQESAYAPDINDGVRVNIAPLQKAGLLAADVLAAKDVGKAIADRAEWRSDERRWCREGKLPQPGWWPMEKKHASGQD